MADFTGITAERADEILGMSVVSGAVNEAGHLILTRGNGETIDAGDFTGPVTGLVDEAVTEGFSILDQSIPTYVAGVVVDRGNTAGALSFADFSPETMVNAMFKVTLTGNITLELADLPTPAKAGTQFAMRLKQDATGGRTITLTGGFKKAQGVLTLTATPNAIDMLVFIYDGAQWYAGLMGADFK